MGVTGEEAKVAIDAGLPGTRALLVQRFSGADVVDFFSLDRRYRYKLHQTLGLLEAGCIKKGFKCQHHSRGVSPDRVLRVSLKRHVETHDGAN